MENRLAIQESLRKLGLYNGRIDGSIGQQTERSIVAFQRSISARQTGVLTQHQIKVLLSSATPVAEDGAMLGQRRGEVVAPVQFAQQGVIGQEAANASLPAPPSLVQALNIRTIRGDILLASSVVGFEGYSDGINKLARLLWLKSNPSLIDDPNKTMIFSTLIPPDDRSRYAENGYWKGRNQFERDDSRESFLKNEKARILALIPDLPLTLAEALPFSAGAYNRSTRELAIGFNRYDPWPTGQFGVEVPKPFDYPNKWTVPETTARRIVTMQSERGPNGSLYNLTSLTRYKLQAVRAIENGVLLEMVALDLKVYDSRKFEKVVATIPLPDSAITEARNASVAPTAILDPMFPRLLAIKLKPELGTNDSFVMESFRIRREIERRVVRARRFNHKTPVTNLPLVMSAPMLNSEVAPSSTDVAPFRNWLASAVETVPDTVRLYLTCPDEILDARNAGGRCVMPESKDKPGSTTVDLAKLIQSPDFDWGFALGSGPWIDPAIKASADRYPNAASHQYLMVGRDLPTIMSLSANPHWFEVTVPGRPAELSEVSIDLKVASTQIVPDQSGQNFLSIEVQPASISYKRRGAPQRFDIPATPETDIVSTASSIGRFDILGLRVGMSIDEAVKVMDMTGLKRGDETRNDPFFQHAAVFEKRAPNNSVLEKITLFYAPTISGNPVVAVGRRLDIREHGFRDEKSAETAILPSMIQKYGPPDGEVQDRYTHWAVTPVIKARVKKGISYNHECAHFQFRNFADTPGMGGPMFSQAMKGNCGEMLSANIHYETIQTFVVDDRHLLSLRTQAAARNARPAPPPIKF